MVWKYPPLSAAQHGVTPAQQRTVILNEDAGLEGCAEVGVCPDGGKAAVFVSVDEAGKTDMQCRRHQPLVVLVCQRGREVQRFGIGSCLARSLGTIAAEEAFSLCSPSTAQRGLLHRKVKIHEEFSLTERKFSERFQKIDVFFSVINPMKRKSSQARFASFA